MAKFSVKPLIVGAAALVLTVSTFSASAADSYTVYRHGYNQVGQNIDRDFQPVHNRRDHHRRHKDSIGRHKHHKRHGHHYSPRKHKHYRRHHWPHYKKHRYWRHHRPRYYYPRYGLYGDGDYLFWYGLGVLTPYLLDDRFD